MRTSPFMLITLATLAAATSGCAQLLQDGAPTVHSMDSVKLISPGITDAYARSTYLQDSYSVGDSTRLLMRFEELRAHEGEILTDKKVEVTLTLLDPTKSQDALSTFHLCYLTSNWMMGATWTRVFPSGGDQGHWQHPGGDYHDCIQPGSADASGLVSFDVTDWYLNDVADRGTNYGFVLRGSDSDPIAVYGETSTDNSPRMTWTEALLPSAK